MKRVFGCEICIHSACATQKAHAFPTGQRSAVALTCPAYAIALSAASASHEDV
jgi:hypothetical protein